MSFGSGGGFGGGFGSQNNNQSTGFGGFGSGNNNNTSSGFGSNQQNTGSIFGGGASTGDSAFGGGNNSTSSGFGGGGFGTNNNATTSFGSKPFSSGSTMFGGGNSTFGGGFGGGAATNNTTTSGFGGTNTSGGGLFGSKPSGFGTAATTTGSSNMFGASNNTSGGFGTNTSTGFGTSNTSGGFGAGASNIAPNNGTGTTPFQAIQEKEAGNANSQAQYQTITFMQPYQNFSLEELRSVDYNQGRRFGNQNGQGGAFGQSTGFGGFGTTNNASTGFGSTNTTTNTGGGLFGSTNTNTNTGFGTSTGSAFGTNNNAGGGLFGANNTQNKPATGLFGSTTASTGTTGGGLFGNNNNNTNTGGGFGSGSGGFGASTGGGVFGNNNPAQNKPAFGGFGSTNTNTATTGFGGNTANTGSSLFGGAAQNNTTPAFGTNNQAAPAGNGLFGNSGGGFGQTPQNQQQPQQSGGLFGGGGGGFGQNAQNNQQKPAGMFGAAPATGGGLFGNNQQQQQQPATGGLFGQSKPATGGLFGNTNAAQPAQTGGLFGNSGGATGATGGGLFGNLGGQNNQQNAAGGGLFGASNNQPKPGGLFGNSTGTNNNANGGLFGSSSMGQNNQNGHQLGGSLFGGQSQGQQNQPAMNNSLFGASGNSTLQTSMNTNPYGNDALFTGLATPTQSPGPLATPLSSSQKNRKSAVLPQHKLNPSQSTRLLTPQGKRNTGYGFTYSTYGTPNNGSSQNSPLNGSLFSNGSLSRQFGKSMSSSNLRHTFTPDTSILAPGAFSTNGRSFGNGSLKKLNINRAINARRNLFPQDEEGEGSPAKRVTFTDNGDDVVTTLTNGSNSTELILRQEDEPTSMNGEASKATNTRPEMEQVKPTVSENTVLKPRTSSSLNIQNGQVVDPTPGEYYSEPSLDTLKSMSKRELESVPNFVVGRDGVGKIEFNFGKPINLSDIVLDKIFGGIVVFDPRNVTVYGRDYEGKPQLGAPGLNHPSRIILGNSWPKGTSHKKEDHYHIERLKKVQGTKFEAYVPETGDWIFQVAHFSSYGLNYEDDLEEESEESSSLSPVPETPSQLGSSQISNTPGNDSLASASQSSPDDTFDFKKDMRKRANVPGQFGDEVAYEEDDEEMEENHGESFLGERSVDSLEGQQDYQDESGSELVEDQEMADSVSGPIRATERNNAKEMDLFKDSMKPKSILKTSQVLRPMGTPSKGPFVFDDDWANALQRTISPKKQDRQALRESQGDMLRGRDDNATFTQSVRGQPFKTTMGRMDLMDSLFAETDKRKDSTTTKRVAQGIQFPYAKRPKTSSDLDLLSGTDKDFHGCNKPHFSEKGVIVYAGKHLDTGDGGIFSFPRDPIAGAEKDIRFRTLPTFADAVPPTVELQKQHTKVLVQEHAPLANLRIELDALEFKSMSDSVALGTPASAHEQQAWKLLSLLYDDNIPEGVTSDEFANNRDRCLKEQLSDFWRALVFEDAQKHAQDSITPEEKAIAYLSCNSVADACQVLVEGRDFRLATMISQIGGDDTTRQDMMSQIDEWRRMDVLSEMDESARTLYELIAGNCARSEGKTGGGRENKAQSFGISSRFNLDWRRAFGLRLWYGTKIDEPIELAVAQFADALRFGNEDVKPVPWFIEQGKDMGWTDPEKTREDLLWGILKLYASAKMEIHANVEDVLAPENVSGHPLNARMSFQLFNLFKSRAQDQTELAERIVGMPVIREKENHQSSFLSTASTTDRDDGTIDPLVELGDKLALTYAASLHTPEHWTTAAWVYAHLSHAATRAHYIRSLLAQFSYSFSLTHSDATFQYLSNDLSIPQTWIHAAAALQAKTEGDALRQAMHLIKANELKEAHEVLCRTVGPESIISRDYDPLRELLGGFMPTPPSSPTQESFTRRRAKEPVQGWSQGGQIYFDYIELLDLTGQRSAYRVDEDLNERIAQLLTKLSRALELVRITWERVEIEERVALREIAGTVADGIAKIKPSERSRVLKLPLTEDLWLKHSVELSTSYYRNVIVTGR